jgi:AbrB family looped-hinge helix DNA binding protein
MNDIVTHLGRGGRIVIPARLRRKWKLKTGDRLVLVEEEDGLRVLTVAQAVLRAQGIAGRYLAKGRSLAAELVAERREEGRGA